MIAKSKGSKQEMYKKIEEPELLEKINSYEKNLIACQDTLEDLRKYLEKYLNQQQKKYLDKNVLKQLKNIKKELDDWKKKITYEAIRKYINLHVYY